MTIFTVARKTTEVVALSATAIALAVAAMTAAPANAKPRESNCAGIATAMDTSIDMAQAAYADGEEREGDSWMRIYWNASANWKRYCL